MAQYTRKPFRFDCLGISLGREIDDLLPGKFNILKNVRSYKQGVIQPRFGQSPYNVTPLPDLLIHSIKRLNNDLSTAALNYTLILGSGSSIYSDTNSSHNSFTSRASGFSGDPLSIVPFRPNNSPEPYAYISDRQKAGKLKVDGSFSNMGIQAPSFSPTPTYSPPTRTIIDNFTNSGAWGVSGIMAGGAVKFATQINFGPINFILYDAPATVGYCSINPNSTYVGVTSGNQVIINSGFATQEIVIIEEVIPGISTTTIKTITYDSGATGLCTIVLHKNSRRRVTTNGLLRINATETVKILSTSIGSDDQQSFRCLTTINHAVGEGVVGLDSFRCVTVNPHAAGEAVAVPCIQDGGNGTATGIATLTRTGLTLDLSEIQGRPVQDTDEMIFCLRLTPATEVSEVQILLDCGNGTFSQDYFIKSIKSSDFQQALTQQLTTSIARQKAIQSDAINTTDLTPDETPDQLRKRLQTRLQKAIQNNNLTRAGKLSKRLARLDGVNDPNNPGTGTPVDLPSGGGLSSQTGQAGNDQYWTLRFRISELLRVGSNSSVGLKNINALRINIFVTASAGIGDPGFQFSSWWLGGTFGPDVGDIGTPYIYRYRYRSSTTGAKSYPSPYSRDSINPRRQRVILSASPSLDSQVDKIDWFRFGGSRNIWTYIGTGPNSTTPFNDDSPDLSIAGNPELSFEDFQPFPIQSTPITATCSVSGTAVTITSGSIPLTLAPGIDIIIDGTLCTLYAPPSSTTRFEVVENLGGLTNVTLYIPTPTLLGQPLPSLWGPFNSEGNIGSVLFACGDSNNEGTLYWTNFDDPDSASDKNFYEVSSPSEPLMNGFVYDSRAWVFSSEDLFQIYPSQTITGRLTFQATRTGLGLGLVGRYAFCTFEGKIAFVAKDGIYITEGHTPISITDDDLYSLFPHDGQMGVSVNGFSPPDFTQSNSLRLSEGGSELRFEYLGVDANYHTIVYNTLTKSWWPDDYFRQVTTSYWEESGKSFSTGRWMLGTNFGKLYSHSGFSDDGQAISCQIRTKCEDGGDLRSKKKFGDFIVDYDPSGIATPPVAQIGFDNYSSLPIPTNLLNTSGRKQTIIDINNGEWTYAKNAALDITWSSNSVQPKFYAYELTALQTEEDTLKRSTDADNLGIDGAKWVQGFRLRCNTYHVVKSFKIQADTGMNGIWTDIQTFNIDSNGETIQPFSFTFPFICHLVRIIGNDNNPWSILGYEFVWEPEPELVEYWITQQTTHSLINYQHINYLQVTLVSTAIVNLVLIIDGIAQPIIQIPSTAGLRLKRYVRVPALKGKTYQYSLSTSIVGTGFRVYQRDLEIAVKYWASPDPYRILSPFGDLHRESGARI